MFLLERKNIFMRACSRQGISCTLQDLKVFLARCWVCMQLAEERKLVLRDSAFSMMRLSGKPGREVVLLCFLGTRW